MLSNGEILIKNYKDLTIRMVCQTPTGKCYFGQCIHHVLDILVWKFYLKMHLNKKVSNVQTEVTDWQSVSPNWNRNQPYWRIIGLIVWYDSLSKLLKHSYLWHKKENLPLDQCIVRCDFSENYSFVLQDSAEGFHWNNAKATLHTKSFCNELHGR